MSAPEIAQLKGRTLNSPLTQRQRAKNSPFHREVIPAYREGSGGDHGGSDSGASYGCQPCGHLLGWGSGPLLTISAGRSTVLQVRPPLAQAFPTWKVLAGLLPLALQSQPALTDAPKTPAVIRASPLLPPLRPSPPSTTEKTEGEAIR